MEIVESLEHARALPFRYRSRQGDAGPGSCEKPPPRRSQPVCTGAFFLSSGLVDELHDACAALIPPSSCLQKTALS
jgi:hypothetical protein